METLLPSVAGKELARIHILSAGRATTLSIPVEGGAHALTRREADPGISGHGKWRREHLGALETAYSRTPFYLHLIPAIEAVYALPDGTPLSVFNRELLRAVWPFIDPEPILSNRDWVRPDSSLRRRCAETATNVNTSVSILDTLFRLGKETAYAIAHLAEPGR